MDPPEVGLVAELVDQQEAGLVGLLVGLLVDRLVVKLVQVPVALLERIWVDPPVGQPGVELAVVLAEERVGRQEDLQEPRLVVRLEQVPVG